MRVFLSFHVPEEDGARLLGSLGSIPGFSPYPPETLHVTLEFIGEADKENIDKLTPLIEQIAAKYNPPFNLEFKEFFVEENRLRAAIKPTTALLQLQGEICVAVRSIFKEVNSHVYIPHITLGRAEDSFSRDSLPETSFEFKTDEFCLFESVQYSGTDPQYRVTEAFHISGSFVPPSLYKTIILPARPQVDTIIAIFLLKSFGEDYFPGIKEASYQTMGNLPEGETEESLEAKGSLLIDIGAGKFDHHKRAVPTTASNLLAEYLGIKGDQALQRMLQFAERDDMLGKGIISTDPLDKAFGLPGLISSLNKKYINDPNGVIEPILPLMDAFYTEEVKRVFEMPKELEEKMSSGHAHAFVVRQRSKKLKVIFIESDNASMAGFLRSKNGGGYDVVALRLSSGHVNILTRPMQRVDLRSLAVLIRLNEGESRGDNIEDDPQLLSASGIYKRIPNWYYDTATNSMLNGGPNPQNVEATRIDSMKFQKILEQGLSEELWSPMSR